jgi:hypothetical protein
MNGGDQDAAVVQRIARLWQAVMGFGETTWIVGRSPHVEGVKPSESWHSW